MQRITLRRILVPVLAAAVLLAAVIAPTFAQDGEEQEFEPNEVLSTIQVCDDNAENRIIQSLEIIDGHIMFDVALSDTYDFKKVIVEEQISTQADIYSNVAPVLTEADITQTISLPGAVLLMTKHGFVRILFIDDKATAKYIHLGEILAVGAMFQQIDYADIRIMDFGVPVISFFTLEINACTATVSGGDVPEYGENYEQALKAAKIAWSQNLLRIRAEEKQVSTFELESGKVYIVAVPSLETEVLIREFTRGPWSYWVFSYPDPSTETGFRSDYTTFDPQYADESDPVVMLGGMIYVNGTEEFAALFGEDDVLEVVDAADELLK